MQKATMQNFLSGNKPMLKWMIPLIAGFAFVRIGFFIFKKLTPNYPIFIVGMSKDMQLPLQETQELNQTMLNLGNGATATEAQWKSIQRLVENDNIARKRFALLMLGTFNKTKYRQEAIHYSEELVNSPDSSIKARSVSVLAHLHDSRWKQFALQNLNSSDPVLKSSATALLERQDRFK